MILEKASSFSWMTTPEIQLDLSLCSAAATDDNGSCSSKDLFRQQSGFGSPIAVPTLAGFQHHLQGVNPPFRPAGSALSEKQSGDAQLTIFYGGMVKVYDDIPAHKAQEIMLLASSASGGNKNSYGSGVEPTKSLPVVIHNQPTCKVSDLPIARKHSLQSFLEKRKSRHRKM